MENKNVNTPIAWNTTIAWVYKTRSGNLNSVPVRGPEFEAAQQIHEGGKYLIKLFTEEQRANMRAKRPDNTPPDGVIEFVSKVSVEEFENRPKI